MIRKPLEKRAWERVSLLNTSLSRREYSFIHPFFHDIGQIWENEVVSRFISIRTT